MFYLYLDLNHAISKGNAQTKHAIDEPSDWLNRIIIPFLMMIYFSLR